MKIVNFAPDNLTRLPDVLTPQQGASRLIDWLRANGHIGRFSEAEIRSFVDEWRRDENVAPIAAASLLWHVAVQLFEIIRPARPVMMTSQAGAARLAEWMREYGFAGEHTDKAMREYIAWWHADENVAPIAIERLLFDFGRQLGVRKGRPRRRDLRPDGNNKVTLYRVMEKVSPLVLHQAQVSQTSSRVPASRVPASRVPASRVPLGRVA